MNHERQELNKRSSWEELFIEEDTASSISMLACYEREENGAGS